jgi:hypothetical protein
MNGNVVGARTLAYLRGENDLFQEKERFEQARKQIQDSGFKVDPFVKTIN